MARYLYRFSDAVVLLSEKHASDYTFLKEAKKYVIPNAIPFFCDKKAECINKRILFLSRLSYEKGGDLLLDIAKELKEKIPDWRIDIYGEGSEEKALKQKAKDFNLENFVYFHPTTTEAKEKYLESSIYLMTSRNEGLPMVLLEAQACGLPIVSYDCDTGPRCIIEHKKNGFLIPVGNKEKYIESVLLLANNILLRKNMGEYSFTKTKTNKYSQENVFSMWQELFQKLL